MTVSAPTTATAAPPVLGITRLWAVAVLLGLPLLSLIFPQLWLRMAILLIVGWAMPGLLLAQGWRLPDTSPYSRIVAAWGLGACWLLGGALVAHYLPGPLLEWHLWAVYGLGGVALALGVRTRLLPKNLPHASEAGSRWGWDRLRGQPEAMAGLGLLGAALLLRLPGLGYHEFHTDEVVLIRQAGLGIAGHLSALAEHTKGPGEIAVTLAVYRALGSIDELTARLPFALMSVGSILAAGWLGYRLFLGLFGRGYALTVGVWGGLLLLLNGFALGLSRIAQYQAGILLLSALAVWAMWEFSQSGRPRWLSLAGVFSTFGLMLHYEFGLLAPVLILLAVLGVRKCKEMRALRQTVLWTGALAALGLAVAYVPPLFNPYFATTQSYLSNRLGEMMVFNWPFFVEMGTFYNSVYFFFGLMFLAAAGTWLGLRRTLSWPVRLPVLVLSAWWLPFFVLYIFVVRYPGTHFYQMMTPWALLAALPLAWLTRALWRQIGRRGPQARPPATPMRRALVGLASAGVLVWVGVSVFYLHLLFFRQDPEYLVNHAREGMALYWAPYPVPQKPRFGFPIYAGWKTIGMLGEWGYLTGTYSSNDRSWGLRMWYRERFSWIEQWDGPETPDYMFSAIHIQEENLTYHQGYHDLYQRIGEVRVRGEPRIALWAREPTLPVPYVTFDAEDFEAVFLQEYAPLPHPAPPVSYPRPNAPGRTLVEPADGRLLSGESGPPTDAIRLATAYLPTTGWRAGAVMHLTFVWQPEQPVQRDYKLFVHVADGEGRPLAQWDGYPGLNTARTSAWQPDTPFADHVLLTLPADMPRGEYRLLVGLYDPETGARLGDRALDVAPVTLP